MLKMLVVAGLAVIPNVPQHTDAKAQFLAWECFGAVNHYERFGTQREKIITELGFFHRRKGAIPFTKSYCVIKYGLAPDHLTEAKSIYSAH